MCGGGGSMGVGVSAFVRVFERERETHQTFHVYSGKVIFRKKPISGNLLLLHSFMNAKNRPNISFHAPLPRRKHVNFTGTDGRAQTPYTSDQRTGVWETTDCPPVCNRPALGTIIGHRQKCHPSIRPFDQTH